MCYGKNKEKQADKSFAMQADKSFASTLLK